MNFDEFNLKNFKKLDFRHFVKNNQKIVSVVQDVTLPAINGHSSPTAS